MPSFATDHRMCRIAYVSSLRTEACFLRSMAPLHNNRLAILTHLARIVCLVSFMLVLADAGIMLSTLRRNLIVSTTTLHSENSSFPVVKAGRDQLNVSWSLNRTVNGAGLEASYKNVQLKLCFAPESQIDRSWRNTNDDLAKDKTCHFEIASQPYAAAGNTTVWTVSKVIPTATYFIRAYVLDSQGNEVAYGQTTNKNKTSNLLRIESISGRRTSLDIGAILFSVFSVSALFLFFIVEKRRSPK